MTDLSSPLLPLLGLIGAALAGNHALRGVSSSSGRQGRKVQVRRGLPSSQLGGYNPTNKSDMKVRPPTIFNVPKSVPGNIATRVAWDSIKINGSNTFSGTAITEQNFSFTLSQHNQASSWAALFDQYSIPQVTIEWDSTIAPGATTTSPMIYTALDFDSDGALGSIARIEDFASSEAHSMTPQHRFMRSVRPTTKVQVNTTTGNAPLGVLGPTWVDASDTTAKFFGIRSILGIGAGSFNTTITIWYCFRNQI